MEFLPLDTKRSVLEVTDTFWIMFSLCFLVEILFIPIGWMLLIIVAITVMVCRILDTAEPRINYLTALYRATAPRLTANYSDSLNPLYLESKFMDEFVSEEEEYHG